MKTIETLAYLCTRIVARIDDDPYDESGDIILPGRAIDDLLELHRELHVLRRSIKSSADVSVKLEDVKSRHIEKIIAYSGGDYSRAAKTLGIDVATIYRYRVKGRIIGHDVKKKEEAK